MFLNINLSASIEHIQKLEIKNPSAGALIHRQQTIHWIFTQIRELSSKYRHKPIVTYWALKKRQAGCLRFMRNTNL